MNRVIRLLVAVSVAGLSACSENKAPEPPKEEPKPAVQPAAEAPKPAAPVEDVIASVSGTSHPDCVGAIEQGVPAKVTLGKRQGEINGSTLTLAGTADADDQVVVGVIATVNEASKENLANLDLYKKFFEEQKVELVLVAGDTGETQADIENVLRKVADWKLPTVVIVGNRESRADYTAALAAVTKDAAHIINGNKVRKIVWDDVQVVTLPGHHDVRYIHAGENGCQYHKEDVDGLAKLAEGATAPVLLLAHTPPKGAAETALDVISPDKQHSGDANLTAALTAAKIPFGVFPNVKEAGARAVSDPEGKTPVAEGTPSGTLYVNPGPGDSLAWTMHDGSSLTGSVAAISIQGKQATYKLFKAPKATTVATP